MNRLIEDYLRTRGVRYFRGHHDEEYFYLVSVGPHRGRLNVHLEVIGAARDAVALTISADRYYPISLRDDLVDLVGQWNIRIPTITAVVHASSDPRLVGVTAGGQSRPADAMALSEFVDAAVTAAIELFRSMPDIAAGARQAPGIMRDAG